MNELQAAKKHIAKLEAAFKEQRELLLDRENTISMLRDENEKRLYEIMELRGKVEVYERVLECVRAFGNV